MPNSYINKLVKQGKGSKAKLEKKWEDAKAAAAAQGHKEDWAYIMSIFQKMAHVAGSGLVLSHSNMCPPPPDHYLARLIKDGKGDKKFLLQKWREAEYVVHKAGHADTWSHIMSVFQTLVKADVAMVSLSAKDPLDTITVDVPLFIRLLELARETLKGDVELHDVVEAVLKLSKEKDVLTMDDYSKIWTTPEPDTEEGNTMAIKALARLKTLAKDDSYVVKNGDKYLKGSFGGGGQMGWTTDKAKATKFSSSERKSEEKSVKMRGYKWVKV